MADDWVDSLTDEQIDAILDAPRPPPIDPTRPHIVHRMGSPGRVLCGAELGVSLLGAPTIICPDCAAIVMRVVN